MKNGFRRLAAIFMTALMLLAVVPVGALGAEQYSKSIIPAIDLARIIQPDDTPVATYIFYNGTAEYARQSVKNTEELYKPQTPPAAEGTVFTGWAREDGTLFDSFGPQTVTETVEIKLYAKFDKAYYVYFYTPDGATLKHTEVVTDNTQTYDFSYVTYEVGSTKKVTGWAAEKNGTVDVSKNVTFGGKTSVSLYAIETEGYWVVFHTGEGSVVPPMFGPAGTTLSLQDVAAPTRVGYTFGGWYDNQVGTGTPIQQVNSAAEVYAKWNPAQVNYTVIHWHENANDDQYSFKEMETKIGTTDGQTNAAAKSYDGFTAQTITQKTIRGDGSTIVNVYYKRNVYDVKFYEYKSWEWQEIAKLRITAKYEANIEDKWPTHNNSNTWATGHGSYGSLSGPYQVNLFKMPLGGKKFYGPKTGNGSESAYYYVEVIPGESGEVYNDVTYKLHHKDTSPGTGYSVTAEDQYPLEGYTYKEGTRIGGAYNNAKFYYTRNQYVITFINGGVADKTVNKKYEQPIEDADYTPANPPAGKEGYVFDGWYDNELGEGEQHVFTGKTMPARNITLYAKWSAPTHKVTFDLGYDAPPEATTPPTQTVQHRETAQQPEDPTRDGFSFTGWYDEDGSPFNFATLIVKDVNLTAHWLSNSTFMVEYEKNGGDGTAPVDSIQYADGAGATVKDKGGLTHPKGMVFLGWATVAANPATIYQPGDKLPIQADMDVNGDGVITLYAVWGDKPVQTKLTYNANFGETPPEKVYYELENNATVTILDYDNAELGLPLRPGYEFLGWSEDRNAKETDKLYKAGDQIIVDETDATAKNILYAIWKQSTVTLTVTKTVTGNFGDKSKAFQFSMQVDGGNSFELTAKGTALPKGSQSDYIFSLKHGENIVIEGMPVGKKIVLAETNAEQYTVSFNDTVETNRNYVNEKGLKENTTINVTNHRNVSPDTGVFVDSLPYILIIACVAGVAALFLIRRRKKRED